MRTHNPTLNDNIFSQSRSYGEGETMTLQGTVNKTLVLLMLVVMSAMWVWKQAFSAPTMDYMGNAVRTISPAIGGYMMAGGILGFITAMVTVFKREWAGVTAPIYALLEGLFIGGISAMFEARMPGIVMQAVGLTFGTLFSLLMLYKSGVIRATEKFKRGVFAATGAICLIYFVNIIMSMFGVHMTAIHGSGLLGIGFSLVVVGVAAMNLVMDFDFIEKGSSSGAPKYMEWYGAFGLMVTLIWLYVELLRLLSKLNNRR